MCFRILQIGTSFSRLRIQGPQTPGEDAQIEGTVSEDTDIINTCFGVIPNHGYMNKCVFH
jgi:hypothetical protein